MDSMSHAKNEQIAKHLRALADQIEKSKDEYMGSFKAYGGEPKCVTVRFVDGDGMPVDFYPVCYSLLIGHEGFIRSMAVVDVSARN